MELELVLLIHFFSPCFQLGFSLMGSLDLALSAVILCVLWKSCKSLSTIQILLYFLLIFQLIGCIR